MCVCEDERQLKERFVCPDNFEKRADFQSDIRVCEDERQLRRFGRKPLNRNEEMGMIFCFFFLFFSYSIIENFHLGGPTRLQYGT